tara:strand:+ start:3347 stop:4777 length:1431 start_codon:yes stop_codon:yes gene_type:complete
MPLRKQYFSIPPINAPQAGFSPSGGQPTVIFSVPEQPRALDVSSLRIAGDLVLQDSAGAAIVSTVNINDSNGANVSKATGTNMPQWCGVEGSISKVVMQSKKTRVEVSQVLQYPEYVSLREAYVKNKEDYLTTSNAQNLASGSDAEFVSRRMTLSSSGGKPFSLKLKTPILSQSRVMLDEDHMGGMIITLHLAPDSAFISSYHRDIGTGQTTASPVGARYVLKNLRLEGQYEVLSPQEISSYPAQIGLPSRLSLMSDVVSSVDSSVLNPQVSAVKSFVSVYQTETQENNFLRSQQDFKLPVGVEHVTQFKDALRFPLAYRVEAVPNFRSAVERGTAGFNSNTLIDKTAGIGISELQKIFERALFGGREMAHTSIGLRELESSLEAEFDTRTGGTAATDGVGKNLSQCPLGLGVDQSFNIAGMFEDYQGRDYSLRLTSGINTGNALLPTDFSSVSYVQRAFVPLIERLDTQSLVKTM